MAKPKAKIKVEESDWTGCYRDNWSGIIDPSAFKHPAKFSRGLIRRIYEHCRLEGWLRPGMRVVDPFGGIALGAYDASYLGAEWVGVELEQTFVDLGNLNLAGWNRCFGSNARLIQGDSRQLARVIQEAGMSVSSPPFGDAQHTDKRGANHPYVTGKFKSKETWGKSTDYTHPQSDGQLGTLAANDAGFNLAVASPPFEASTQVNNRPGDMTEGRGRWEGGTNSAARVKQDYLDYGTGNIGNMTGGFDAAVSSPPYETARVREYGEFGGRVGDSGVIPTENTAGYGDSDLGRRRGDEAQDTFWSAARQIVEQTYAVLVPGAHACWVVKGFVRKGKYVDFPDQWRQLCEAVGFTTLHWHRAWLVEESGAQHRLDGGEDEIKTERKSFFRRLAEQKGSPRIDYEVVLCMLRP